MDPSSHTKRYLANQKQLKNVSFSTIEAYLPEENLNGQSL